MQQWDFRRVAAAAVLQDVHFIPHYLVSAKDDNLNTSPKHHCANGVTKHDWPKQLKDKHPDLHKEVRERQVITYIPVKKATFSAKSKQRQPPSLSTKVALEKN